MIPYSTCMRFNRYARSAARDDSGGDGDTVEAQFTREWSLLVPHSSAHNQGDASTIVNVHSQDDQTLCFTWVLDASRPSGSMSTQPMELSTKYPNNQHQIECIPEIHMPKTKDGNGDGNGNGNDEKKGYLLLTLRRRKSIQKSIHIDPIALLDHNYYGITGRYLQNASKWRFNTFTLDVLTGGHSLSNLLFHLFTEYDFFNIFNLDVVKVWRCFRFLESGYHDTNPYHNSVHAADVTQAMHCFLQETKIRRYLTPMETMCSLLAAVCHDLDHPGVNQHFLIATRSHLAALYKNLSVLESHHWRFAISCFHESQIFNHLSSNEWIEIESLLKSLILATDITQQGDYIIALKTYLSSPSSFSMANTEHRQFILHIALKCADLGNPCRPWTLSKRWSEQICNEFYRQGDYERQLNIPITPICDRYKSTIARIQTEFFRNIVTPLFELWDQFLSSPLSKQLITNLRFNNDQWNSSLELKTLTRRVSLSNLITADHLKPLFRRSKSLNNLKDITVELSLSEFKDAYKIPEVKKCINGCGTPPNNDLNNGHLSNTNQKRESKIVWNLSDDECDDEEEVSTTVKPLPHTFAFPTHSSYFIEKKHNSGRRCSAPGCIGIYASCELAAAAAFVFLHGAVEDPKRRSSFPADRVGAAKNALNTMNNGAKMNWSMGGAVRGRSLELLVSTLTKNKGFYTSASAHSKMLRRQAFSLDSGADSPTLQVYYNGKPRRGSVPQEILIESLSNYPAHGGL